MTLSELPVGSRLILKCKKDWREAVVSKFYDGKAVLSVASATGKTYRVRKPQNAELQSDGQFHILATDCEEIEWRENLLRSDSRW